ncbi:hypothetical protein [Methylosinus sp. PW1]|uniref:hypothetical protein n=1 Tax=Methylosinus sp. PW1 TaxID=107636 RepID=UPI0005694A3D|nr:hypothetical protein [Methylosinus sp. PW1]
MADEPEITTSAYSFTRRTLLVASVSAAAPASFGGVAPLDTSRIEAADAAMSMWTQWRAAQDAADVLCQKQQSLETQLMQLIRESCSIDNTDCAEADRAAQEEDERARWAAADLAVGYSEEKKRRSEPRKNSPMHWRPRRRLPSKAWPPSSTLCSARVNGARTAPNFPGRRAARRCST